MGVRKAKAGKANGNAPLSKRPEAFNPQTVSQRSVNHPSDDPLAESAGSEVLQQPSSPQSQSQSEENHLQQRPSGQSRATRNLNEEKAYQGYRISCSTALQTPAYLEAEQERAESLKNSFKEWLQTAALRASCQGCGCPAKDCETHATKPAVEVNFISLNDTFKLNVPIFECSR